MPFVDCDIADDVVSRMEADSRLKRAIEGGYKAAVIATGMDYSTEEVTSRLKVILTQIQEMLPANTSHRLYISYGWLILCTEMVIIT